MTDNLSPVDKAAVKWWGRLPCPGMTRFRAMVVVETIYKVTIEAPDTGQAGAELVELVRAHRHAVQQVGGPVAPQGVESDEAWHEPIVWPIQPPPAAQNEPGA